jgi:pimeloyl-ACP methyl ester carboxylesterase
MPEAIAVMVHGILSSSTTWSSLVRYLKEDDQVAHLYQLDPFKYPSPKARLLPTRRTPDYDTLADSLGTYLEVECAEYASVVLVGHSQGGLIIQRYLARMLSDGRGHELQKIRRVVMLTCPSNGSEFLLLSRRALLPLLRNVQGDWSGC